MTRGDLALLVRTLKVLCHVEGVLGRNVLPDQTLPSGGDCGVLTIDPENDQMVDGSNALAAVSLAGAVLRAYLRRWESMRVQEPDEGGSCSTN